MPRTPKSLALLATEAVDLLTSAVDVGEPADVHEAHARQIRLELALEKVEAIEAMLISMADSTTTH